MTDTSARLEAIRKQLSDGEATNRVTVRAFLAWFDTQRRGFYKVRAIREALEQAGLITDPDFEGAYIDSEIAFRLKPVSATGNLTLPAITIGDKGQGAPFDSEAGSDSAPTASFVGGAVADPTYRIGKLAAANRAPLSVTPDATLSTAITLMLQNDYSQLPVMQGERTVKGVISWQSIGSRLALQCDGVTAKDYMEAAVAVSMDASLFAVIQTVVERQYVLIRDSDNRIAGIVTTSDLSLQFRQLAEPFLLLGEIENHIRRLIDGKFTAEEIRAACDPDDADRQVETVADLTFGEYLRLLESEERWSKVGISLDRKTFLKQLDHVREIRNDVMHFDPDPIATDELSLLQQCASFLRGLQLMGVS